MSKLVNDITEIVASGLLGYSRLVDGCEHKDGKYLRCVPPTREQVMESYNNLPLFHTAVDTIVSHLCSVIREKMRRLIQE